VGFKYTEALARQHEITVLASPPSQTPQGATLVPCDAGPCSFNEVDALALLRFELRQWRLARQLRRRQRFDLMHRLTPSAIQLPTLIALQHSPCVVGPLLGHVLPPPTFLPFLQRARQRPSQPRLHPRRMARGLAGRFVRYLTQSEFHLRRASWILTGTQAAAAKVPERLRSRCRAITYAGVEYSVFVPPALTPGPSPNRIGLGGPIRLLYVGRLVPYKGLELLIRALAQAVVAVPCTLKVVGSGDLHYTDYCRRLVGELGLADRVQFVLHLPREGLVSVYQEADLFCLPSIETYGVALLEAMSCGLAVVVSDINGPGENVPKDCGIKIPMRAPEQFVHDFANAIVALAKNNELRAELGSAGRRHVLANHSWDRIARDLLSLYDEIAAAENHSPRRSVE